jgi:hypothetical protein
VAISFSIFFNNEKMRSSRPQKAMAQDDRLKNSLDGIFRLDPHANCVAPDEDKKSKIRHAMACRYMNWAL